MTALFLFLLAAPKPLGPITVNVDLREAPRHIVHTHLVISAAPGALLLRYPKWLPGTHSPYGPIENVTGLRISAGGKALEWRRDPVELYGFHIDVPKGASRVDVDFDVLSVNGGGTAFDAQINGAFTSAQLAILAWNLVVLYPDGHPVRELTMQPSVRLPAGWQLGSSLAQASHSGDTVTFKPVSLEALVDSPVLAGAHFKTLPLGGPVGHQIHLAAESAAALDGPAEWFNSLKRLVAEAQALFGAHHYDHYAFLLALSDAIGGIGWEHHQSSDNRVAEASLTDDNHRKLMGSLLPHEFSHSWNGKYRRPASLTTPDFQQPQQGDLLWVYEGLTTWLGDVLAARSGFWTAEQYRESLAFDAANLEHTSGRSWGPLGDTAVAGYLLYGAHLWSSWRRSVDYYPEGALIWLEVDSILRSKGKRLDDFCRAFHGAPSGGPAVKTYNLDDVINTLNGLAAYDWRGLLHRRIYALAPHAPLAGIENDGWKLVYTDKPNDMQTAREQVNHFANHMTTLGLQVGEDGTVFDVELGSLAGKAALAPMMKLVAVNGRHFKLPVLLDAIKRSKSEKGPIELLVENAEYLRTVRIDYHGGARWPHLERDARKPDLLSEVLKPLAK